VVLVDVPADALILREETFGPVLPVVRARDAGHAVELANANPYGLGAAVFAGRRADRIARALRSGMTSINSVLTYAGIPSLPLGGVGSPASAASTAPTASASSPAPRLSPASASPCPSGCRASTAPASSSRPSARP
jgi:delta 1-pyrroline-5-carboxylate dehydrogenase